MQRKIVLLSGGLDSTTILSTLQTERESILAVSFDYGQRHRRELYCAAHVARHFQVEHTTCKLRLGELAPSALTSLHMPVPIGGGEGIPSTYVPARNTVFLSLALSIAEGVGAESIYIGCSSIDYSGYPDCRPAFIDAFNQLSGVATKRGVDGCPVTIHAPLLQLSKAETIRLGLKHHAPYHLTSTCYDPKDNRACGQCDACAIRLSAWAELGMRDPILYQDSVRTMGVA